MIFRVNNEVDASICDNLLTKLIQDEKKYNDYIDDNFVVKDYFKNVIKDEKNILLCYKEDEIIKGYIYLKNINEGNKNGYLIDGLYVLEEYRNNGIAKELINSSLSILKSKNINFIDVNTMYKNKEANNLYKSLGFTEFKISYRMNLE